MHPNFHFVDFIICLIFDVPAVPLCGSDFVYSFGSREHGAIFPGIFIYTNFVINAHSLIYSNLITF